MVEPTFMKILPYISLTFNANSKNCLHLSPIPLIINSFLTPLFVDLIVTHSLTFLSCTLKCLDKNRLNISVQNNKSNKYNALNVVYCFNFSLGVHVLCGCSQQNIAKSTCIIHTYTRMQKPLKFKTTWQHVHLLLKLRRDSLIVIAI
jgi:hypothetical protein